MNDQKGPATPTGVPEFDAGNGGPAEQEDDRPANRAEDMVDIDVKTDDIESDPAADAGLDAPPGADDEIDNAR